MESEHTNKHTAKWNNDNQQQSTTKTNVLQTKIKIIKVINKTEDFCRPNI